MTAIIERYAEARSSLHKIERDRHVKVLLGDKGFGDYVLLRRDEDDGGE